MNPKFDATFKKNSIQIKKKSDKLFKWFSVGPVSRVSANDPGDLGSIPGQVIPKTLKMVLDTSLLNTRQYKVRVDKVANFTYFLYIIDLDELSLHFLLFYLFFPYIL